MVVKGSITMFAANIVKYSCMNSKDVCVNNLTAEEQARNTYDRLNEIRSYGFEVEEIWECSIRGMLKAANKCKKCTKNKKCSEEDCQMLDFFVKTSMDSKVFYF